MKRRKRTVREMKMGKESIAIEHVTCKINKMNKEKNIFACYFSC